MVIRIKVFILLLLKDNSTWVDISNIMTFAQTVNVDKATNYTSEAYRYFRFLSITDNANRPMISEFNIVGSDIN